MALSPAFTLGQNPLYPNIVVASDDSTGTDVLVTQRRIFIQDTNGTYLVPSGTTTNYTQWNYADLTISLNILTQDTAVDSTVKWLDVNDAVLYEVTNQFCLSQYTKQELYYLVQLQGLTPNIPADANYDANAAILWATLLGAINAVEQYDDIAASQNCLDRCFNMIQKQSIYF